MNGQWWALSTTNFLLFSILQAFCIYMLITSFAYFLFLFTDIRLHVNRAKMALEDRQERQQLIEEHIDRMRVSSQKQKPIAPF